MSNPESDLPLPVWVDHVGSKDTASRQFRLLEDIFETPKNDSRRITNESRGEEGL